MSTSAAERKAILGKFVLGLFPQVMQYILKEHISPRGLHVKYMRKNIHIAFTDSEISLMEKLPHLDEFTIDLCYKILRFEHLIYEPRCKWGNDPHNTEVEIADDIQRILNLTNEVIGKMSTELPNEYFEDFQKKTVEVLKRIDAYLCEDSCFRLYETICRSDVNCTEIIEKVTDIQPINVKSIIDEDEDEYTKREYYTRISQVIIDTFPKIIRNIMYAFVHARVVYQKCIPHLKKFSPEQQAILQTLQWSNSYDSLDIYLMYKLLRQFQLILPPTKGWGSFPDKNDIKVADDVERIRSYRNKIAHRCSTDMRKDEFEDYFDQFRDIGHRIDMLFSRKNTYEKEIIESMTCRMDMQMQVKYKDAMKKLGDLKLGYEKRPLKFYWGENFDLSLRTLRSVLQDEASEGRRKLSLQIIFQNEDDCDATVNILNSLKAEINDGLSGIEFIIATKGSLILDVYILLKMMETDEILQCTLTLFVEKILEHITISTPESIDMIVLPVEEYETLTTTKHIEKSVYLDFNIEARLLETDDKMEEQLSQISEAIFNHNKERGKNPYMSALVLPISLDHIAIVSCLLTTERKSDKHISDDYPPTETVARNVHGENCKTIKTHTTVNKELNKNDFKREDNADNRHPKFGKGIQGRRRSSSLSKCSILDENEREKDWFYKLEVTCDNYSLHLINDFNVLRKFSALSEAVKSTGHTELKTDLGMNEKVSTAFERIYKHMICTELLLMADCIKQNFDLAVRFLLARHIQSTELGEFLNQSMKENRKDISKAIGWSITKQFCKVIQTSNIIDVWPGFHCRCDQSQREDDSIICSTEPVIVVEVDKFSNVIQRDFYGIPIEQSFPILGDKQTIKQCTEKKTKVSSPSACSGNVLHTSVSISSEIAEMCFKKHSKLTMIYTHPLGRTIIQLCCQIKGVIPMGEQHFPKTINGMDTNIAEGHVRFVTKIQIGDSICRLGSFTAGTLGGFVQWNGCDAFLTCAHVVYDMNTLIAGNKRERHRSKTNIEFAKLPTKDPKYPSPKTYAGFVVDSDFPDEDRVRTCGTSVDAAVVVLQGDTCIDNNDILNDRTSVVKSMNFLGMKGSYLNDNYITPKALVGTVEAKYVGMTSGYVESNVTFEDYDKNDDKFKNKPHGLSLYFKDVKSHLQEIENECPRPLEIPFEVHFQQLVVPKLDEKLRSGRHFFRFYDQLLLEQFSFEPGDSGTCIYVVEDKTIVRPDNQPNPTGCLAMAIASFYDSNEKRNKCIATPMQAILKTLNLI